MRLIYIEWADAISPASGWKTEEEALEWSKTQDYWVSQVGWILKENKEFLLLSSQKNTTKDIGDTVDQFSHIIKIPKTWIRKRKTIKI